MLTNPLGLLALLGIPAVLAIHFLQRKAVELPVSTLFLLERTQREAASGRRPNVDFKLAAICVAYGRPAGPALSMFAAGRLAGWLAHALEQQALGGLIRPRASYTGLQPEADADVAHD